LRDNGQPGGLRDGLDFRLSLGVGLTVSHRRSNDWYSHKSRIDPGKVGQNLIALFKEIVRRPDETL
jgi:hypothetical protein